MDVARLDPADLDVVRPGYVALCEHLDRLETGMGPLREPEELWTRRRGRYAGWLERPESAIFVARDEDGSFLGYVMVQARDPWLVRRTSDPTGDVQTIAVMPGARGRGVGAALLRAAEEHLRAQGVRDVTVGVSTVNQGARRFYAREGWRPLLSVWWARPVPEIAPPAVPVEVVDPADVDELLPLWAALMDHHDAVRPAYLPERRDPAESFAARRENLVGDESILLRAPGGYVHATIGGGFDVWDTGRVGMVESLVVEPGRRGRGTGTALLAGAFEVLRTRQAQGVELDVLEGNAAAYPFYARHGLQREFESLYKRL